MLIQALPDEVLESVMCLLLSDTARYACLSNRHRLVPAACVSPCASFEIYESSILSSRAGLAELLPFSVTLDTWVQEVCHGLSPLERYAGAAVPDLEHS